MIYKDEKAGAGRRRFGVEEYGIVITYNTDIWNSVRLKKHIKDMLAEGEDIIVSFKREINEGLIEIKKGDE